MLRGGVVHAHLGGLERGVECMIGVQSREVDCWGQHSLAWGFVFALFVASNCAMLALCIGELHCELPGGHGDAWLRRGLASPACPVSPTGKDALPRWPTRLPPGIDEVDEWLPDALWQVGGERGVSFSGPSASQRRWGGGRAHRELQLQQGTVIELESELVERPRARCWLRQCST
jgi:hypothetical protein